jgi:hypothetical protein
MKNNNLFFACVFFAAAGFLMIFCGIKEYLWLRGRIAGFSLFVICSIGGYIIFRRDLRKDKPK